MMAGTKKDEMQKLIDAENGNDYHKNINLNGYAVYRDKSFISFRILTVLDKPIVVIDYMYMTSKRDFIQILAWCINFWTGNEVKYIYYKEHKRKSNIVRNLTALGFSVIESNSAKWKRAWKSTNGFPESNIIEAYTDSVDA